MSEARSLLILLLISTSVSAADLCKAKNVVKKVAPGDDGVAAFELKLNERVVIEAFKATVCVAAFLPDRDSKSGRTGPSVDYVVHTAKGDSTINSKMGLTFTGNFAAAGMVLEPEKTARVQLMRSVTACQTSGRFGTQRECLRNICKTDTESKECQAWKAELKRDQQPPQVTVHLRDGWAIQPNSKEPIEVIGVSAHGSDASFVRELEWRSGAKSLVKCEPRHDGETCNAEIPLSSFPRELTVTVTDEARQKTKQALPMKLTPLRLIGNMRMQRTDKNQWFAKVTKPECGDFEVPLGKTDGPAANGGCNGERACEVEGDFLVLDLPVGPSITGQRCFLKTLRKAVPTNEFAAEPPPVLKNLYRLHSAKERRYLYAFNANQGGPEYQSGAHVFSISLGAGRGLKQVFACGHPVMGEFTNYLTFDSTCGGRGGGTSMGFISEKPNDWARLELRTCTGLVGSVETHLMTTDPKECPSAAFKLQGTLGYVGAPLP